MSFVLEGLIVSGVSVIVLGLLFRFEGNRGVRFAAQARTHADFAVLRFVHFLEQVTLFLSRDFIRQVLHYSFHTLLRLVLSIVRRSEKSIRTMMQVNKTIAKNVEREGMMLTKLEEVALHKIATTMTDTEKKAHKDKILSGK